MWGNSATLRATIGTGDMFSTTASARHQYTYDEYLAYERDSALKHDYDGGEILAMAGGSVRHNALASRISAVLESTRPSGYLALQSDQRIRVLATGRTTYPDATVVCGPIERDPADPSGMTITNPLLLVEVLSPSTEKEDRGNKWNDYQRTPRCRIRAGRPIRRQRGTVLPPRAGYVGVFSRDRRPCRALDWRGHRCSLALRRSARIIPALGAAR